MSLGVLLNQMPVNLQNSDIPVSTTFTGGLRYAASYSPHLRRSLPNMARPMSTEPAKIYPYHLLLITNYRLPADVDRLNIEVRHEICDGRCVFVIIHCYYVSTQSCICRREGLLG
jgi:hypothetical protein